VNQTLHTTSGTTFRGILTLASRHRFLVSLALLGPTAVALWVGSTLPATRRAQTSLVVDSSSELLAQDGGNLARREYVNTEIDLLTDPVVVDNTISRVGLATIYPDLSTSSAGPQNAKDSAIRQFEAALRVDPIKGSNVIHVTFDHNDASTAIYALNQFMISYQELHASIFSSRHSRRDEKLIAQDTQDLHKLEQTRAETTAAFGIHDLSQQRASLIEQRAEADKHLRETADRSAELSSRLATLARMRGNVSSITVPQDTEPEVAHAPGALANLTETRTAPVRAHDSQAPASRRARQEIEVVEDRAPDRHDTPAPMALTLPPIQLAARLLSQFIVGRNGLELRQAGPAQTETYEQTLARDLRNLDKLEHTRVEGKALDGGHEVPRQRALRIQPDLQTMRRSGNMTYLANDDTGAFNLLSEFVGPNPTTIKVPDAVIARPPKAASPPPVQEQQTPLVTRLWRQTEAVQRQFGDMSRKISLSGTPATAAIDRNLMALQTELEPLTAQEVQDGLMIQVIDRKLMHLGQADIQVKILDARIADQKKTLEADRKLYDQAKAHDEGDRARMTNHVQTSSATLVDPSMEPNTSLFVVGGILAGLLSSASVLIIASLIPGEGPLELFLASSAAMPSSIRRRDKGRLK